MRQVNIVGTSPPSQPSRKIQTLPAPPDMAPANVTLRTASETSLWFRWMVSTDICSILCISNHDLDYLFRLHTHFPRLSVCAAFA